MQKSYTDSPQPDISASTATSAPTIEASMPHTRAVSSQSAVGGRRRQSPERMRQLTPKMVAASVAPGRRTARFAVQFMSQMQSCVQPIVDWISYEKVKMTGPSADSMEYTWHLADFLVVVHGAAQRHE